MAVENESPQKALSALPAMLDDEGGVLDSGLALEALANLGSLALEALDDKAAAEQHEAPPEKPQRLTPTLIASRCLSPEEASSSQGADARTLPLMKIRPHTLLPPFF